MRYVMKQKLFSLADSFVIRTEAGADAFTARGKVFSFGHQLSFEDASGNEVAYIRQKLLSFGPAYEIYRDGHLFATVKKELFSFIHHTFNIDVPGPDDLEAKGNFLDHEYTFQRGGEVVARVSKAWFSWTDTYGVDIADGQDDALILASSVVIDMICHGDREEH
jgi:uncharacterized protein YxjI